MIHAILLGEPAPAEATAPAEVEADPAEVTAEAEGEEAEEAEEDPAEAEKAFDTDDVVPDGAEVEPEKQPPQKRRPRPRGGLNREWHTAKALAAREGWCHS